jgi:hypothetical protein
MTYLCIKHCVIQVVVWRVQLKVSLDERGAIPVNRVNVRDRFFFRRSGTYQSVDLVIARGIEESTEDILAITEKIL